MASDNEGRNKHVESADVPCLDEGSNPSSSTKLIGTHSLCANLSLDQEKTAGLRQKAKGVAQLSKASEKKRIKIPILYETDFAVI